MDEAPARLETGPTQYCLPTWITEILMRPVTLELHAIRRVGKHCGVRRADEEQIFEILVDTGAQVSLVRSGLLSFRSLWRSAAPVSPRVDKSDIMEGGLDEAEISLELVCQEQLSSPDLGHKHQIKGFVLQGRPAGVGHDHGS